MLKKSFLISLDGRECPFCGVQLTEDNVVYDHIVPRSLGGSNDSSNLRVVCKECNMKNAASGGYEFQRYMFEILSKNDHFRNTKSDVTIGKTTKFIADIVTERKIGDKWERLIIEVKYASSLTINRVNALISRFEDIKQVEPGEPIFVILFPGKLADDANMILKNSNIEIWDIEYISTIFSDEIKQTEHTIFRKLLEHKPKPNNSAERILIDRLKVCMPGKEEWSKYQKLVGEILTVLFCPQLQPPLVENADALNVNRRDFVLPNYCESGVWYFLRSRYFADYIVVDAKNYSKKVTKKEIQQISNYLKLHGAGLFGIIISRNGANEGAMYTLREAWAVERKLIIVLEDNDIEQMLLEKSSGREPEIIIRQKIEDFRLSL